MILRAAHPFREVNLASYAWSGLKRFHNSDYVAELITQHHSLDKKRYGNAKKQAHQLRYCLMQAKEYYDAAQIVSLATKPNLLYYSIMSLALAEILFKQSGLSSLDKARDEHKHHGLQLKIVGSGLPSNELGQASRDLIAVPSIRPSDARFGTFELWHRSSREMPLVGKQVISQKEGTTTSHKVLLYADDRPLAPMPAHGISLFECFIALPGMLDCMISHGIHSRILRGHIKAEIDSEAGSSKKTITLHPCSNELLEQFLNRCLIEPGAVNRINHVSLRSGGFIKWTDDVLNGPVRMSLPHGSNWTADEIRFWPTESPLNEFGYFYVFLYIVGNYARYYPDRWLRDIETSNSLALAIEEGIRLAEARVPLLTLSELSSTYHLPFSV
jgi:hypothetical protein